MSVLTSVFSVYIFALIQFQHVLIQRKSLFGQCCDNVILNLTGFGIHRYGGTDHTAECRVDGVKSPKCDVLRRSIERKRTVKVL